MGTLPVEPPSLRLPPRLLKVEVCHHQRSIDEFVRSTSNSYSRRSGEGFNWSESLRSRAERTSSISVSPIAVQTAPPQHQRATSVAVMEPPVKEMPKTPKAPDQFQERILKGDFYMD